MGDGVLMARRKRPRIDVDVLAAELHPMLTLPPREAVWRTGDRLAAEPMLADHEVVLIAGRIGVSAAALLGAKLVASAFPPPRRMDLPIALYLVVARVPDPRWRERVIARCGDHTCINEVKREADAWHGRHLLLAAGISRWDVTACAAPHRL